ncbi:MAG: hypothetical protein WCO63_00940 [Bacteroidota bacterium]
MAHDHSNETLSPEEKIHQDLESRGDDYFKIELWRWALHYYLLAKETGLHADQVQHKTEMTRAKIKYETRAIIIILCVAVVLTTVIWFIASR